MNPNLGPTANNVSIVLKVLNEPVVLPIQAVVQQAGQPNPAYNAPTSRMVWPATIWVTPNGSTVLVETSIDNGLTWTAWTAGSVTVHTTQVYTSCPGAIRFTLTAGTAATVGVT